jgi:hypothetical protein
MPITGAFKRLLSKHFDARLETVSRGGNVINRVRNEILRKHAGASMDDIKLGTSLVQQGRRAADMINRSDPNVAIPAEEIPLNPYIVPEKGEGNRRYYSTDVEWTDNDTGESGVWNVRFDTPIELTQAEIEKIAGELFRDRYSESPPDGVDRDDADDIPINVSVRYVIRGGS